MILLYFSETERNSAELDIIDRRSQIINSVRSYNRRFSGKKKIFSSLGFINQNLLKRLILVVYSLSHNYCFSEF